MKMFINLISYVIILGEFSNALQCYQCTGKKTNNTNQRLYDKWIKVAKTAGLKDNNTNYWSPPICTDQDVLGKAINCGYIKNYKCTYFAFKDENIKGMDGKM